MAKTREDLFQKVTDGILAQLEKGVLPWVQPYSKRNGDLPCNAISNRPYRGINLLLYFDALANGYAKPRFITFNAAKKHGGHVKKGEKGRYVYLWMPFEKIDPVTKEKKKSMFLKEWVVFNVDQCAGLPDPVVLGPYRKPLNKGERMEVAEEFIKATGAKFISNSSGTPCYNITRDCIMMPSWNDFHGNEEYYATSFHELVHWTGAKDRCDRDFKGRFGSESYAFEELVAEIGSAFLCAEFGFDHVDNGSKYIGNWIKVLSGDKRAIFTAASKAQQAVDFLRGTILKDEEETTEKEAA